MLYRLYRATRQIPGISTLANAALRTARNIFWSLRPVPKNAAAEMPPEDILAFVSRHLADGPPSFTLIEVGAGDGRLLRELAFRFPAARFVGVDIQKAAVSAGKGFLAQQGIGNVELECASCLEDTLSWDCDYLISRTALIYLNRAEIESFFVRRLPMLRRKALLMEIVSLDSDTHRSHFFAHPLADIARKVTGDSFEASTRLLDYERWASANRWSGAEIVIARKGVN